MPPVPLDVPMDAPAADALVAGAASGPSGPGGPRCGAGAGAGAGVTVARPLLPAAPVTTEPVPLPTTGPPLGPADPVAESTPALPGVGLTVALPGVGLTVAFPDARFPAGPGRAVPASGARSVGPEASLEPVAPAVFWAPAALWAAADSDRRISPVLTVARPWLAEGRTVGQTWVGALIADGGAVGWGAGCGAGGTGLVGRGSVPGGGGATGAAALTGTALTGVLPTGVAFTAGIGTAGMGGVGTGCGIAAIGAPAGPGWLADTGGMAGTGGMAPVPPEAGGNGRWETAWGMPARGLGEESSDPTGGGVQLEIGLPSSRGSATISSGGHSGSSARGATGT